MEPAVNYNDDYRIVERAHMLDDVLLDNEQVQSIATISPGIYWKGIAMALAAIVALFYGFGLAFYLGLVAAILIGSAYLTRRYLMLAVTNERIVMGGGILAQEVIFLPFDRVEMVETVQTPMGMLFGYANILISGTGRMRVMIPFVQNAGAMTAEISRLMVEGPREPMTLEDQATLWEMIRAREAAMGHIRVPEPLIEHRAEETVPPMPAAAPPQMQQPVHGHL